MTHLLRARNALLERYPESNTQFVGDALRLGHHRRCDGATERILTDAGERRARQRADGIERQVTPKLQPNLRTDVAEHRSLQAAPDKALRHACNALARRTVRLADGEPITFDVLDDSGSHELRGRIHDAADDALGRDMVV